MQIKKFEASNLADALREVKRALGPEAVILSTRNVRIPQAGKVRPHKRVEVYAARNDGGAPPAKEEPAKEEPANGRADQEKAPLVLEEIRREIRGLRAVLHSPPGGLYDPSGSEVNDSLRGEIEYMGNLLESVSREAHLLRSIGLPRGLRATYQRLVHHGVRPDLVLAQIDSLVQQGLSGGTTGERLSQRLLNKLQEAVRVSGPIVPKNGKRGKESKKVALVGPTGVGKTTTLAKLAANYAVSRDLRVGMITIDTYRVAAVDQLRTYADIMTLPFEVVLTPREFARSLNRLSDRDLILIDTAGRNHRDPAQMAQLREFFGSGASPEVHLVLSSTTAEKDLLETLRLYDPLPFHRMIITKVDESCSLGSVYNLIAATDRPISYITNGQRVPEDIELATVSGVAGLAFPEG